MLLITGSPGSGKNSLIDVCCKTNNISVLRYKDEEDSNFNDFELDSRAKDGTYPKDLENLIHFIRVKTKAHGSTGTQGLKGSSFSNSRKPIQ